MTQSAALIAHRRHAGRMPRARSSRLLRNARDLRRHQTDAENHLWLQLRDRRLCSFKFRRQVPLGPYIADFVCASARLVVELDGGQHLDSSQDLTRDRWLLEQGWTVLRFWNDEVLLQTQAVLEKILMSCAIAHPPPGPSPASGRGRECS